MCLEKEKLFLFQWVFPSFFNFEWKRDRQTNKQTETDRPTGEALKINVYFYQTFLYQLRI